MVHVGPPILLLDLANLGHRRGTAAARRGGGDNLCRVGIHRLRLRVVLHDSRRSFPLSLRIVPILLAFSPHHCAFLSSALTVLDAAAGPKVTRTISQATHPLWVKGVYYQMVMGPTPSFLSRPLCPFARAPANTNSQDQIVFGRGSSLPSSYMSTFSFRKPTSPWIFAHSTVGSR